MVMHLRSRDNTFWKKTTFIDLQKPIVENSYQKFVRVPLQNVSFSNLPPEWSDLLDQRIIIGCGHVAHGMGALGT